MSLPIQPPGTPWLDKRTGGVAEVWQRYLLALNQALGDLQLTGYTVATLPAGTVGDAAYVTNALAPSFLVAVVGGGAVTTPVFYNGSAWVVG